MARGRNSCFVMLEGGGKENTNEDQKRLARMRQKYVVKNPMTMDEINSVIEGE